MTGTPTRRPAAESFARLPWRITAALHREELTLDEWSVVVYVVALIGRERDQVDENGWLVTELAVLKAEMRWQLTTKRLSQVLESLVEKGWLETETRSGSKKWRIRLADAAIIEKGEKIDENGPSDFQLSAKPDDADQDATPHENRDVPSSEPGNAVGPLDVDVEVDKGKGSRSEEEERDGRRGLGEAGSASAAKQVDDVLEAFNQARAVAGEPPLWEPPVRRPLVGEPGYYEFSRAAFNAGHITRAEHLQNTRTHRLVRDTLEPPMGEDAFLADLASKLGASSVEPADDEGPA